MKSVLLDSVAVFVLATTKPFGGVDNQRISSYDSRMIEIAETWTKPLQHVYFVMGSNQFDHKFLRTDCTFKTSFGDVPMRGSKAGQRRLLARVPQTKSVNRTEEYVCDYTKRLSHIIIENNTMNENEDRWHSFRGEKHSMNVLYISNCTGEYFGIGPACRYQESARYFLSHAGMRYYKDGAIEKPYVDKFKGVEWFIFIDDDLYIRPYSLVSMLRTLPQSHPAASQVTRMKNGPLFQKCEGATRAKDGEIVGGRVGCVDFPAAVLAPITARSFLFSKHWDRQKYNCVHKSMKLYLSMPAMINREAMALMRVAVEAGGITELQSVWGGTHDMLLAMWLYMYKIPLFSARSVYYGTAIETLSKKDMKWATFDRQKMVFVHMLKNFAIPVMQGKNRTGDYKQVPGMVDVAKAYGDDILYSHISYMAMSRKNEAGDASRKDDREMRLRQAWKAKYSEQISSGKVASRVHLQVLGGSRVDETPFAEHAATLHEEYVSFRPEHCPLR